ncbi:hypothetical protein SEVIR_8G153800v4 [Setaria viridis]|uniref:Uncharacterized protein n=1 Tax=Setaria viridis TaxID=4556 RepID=A0A4V6D337_SETVI|nr:hypothetical protein SEVIR_8G153800v2 [Setaria viridis]
MADLTHGAVDSLLGLLSTAVKDEARLLGGVHRDVQFIKDEMDSMNGFLMHLTKMEGDHDDQLRAWMKQVRDIAYIAEDCIELYRRDLMPAHGGGGLLARLRLLPVYLQTIPARHRLAKEISELKERVREVGERRLRYDVKVPEAARKEAVKQPGQDKEEEKRLEDFRCALEVAGASMRSSLPDEKAEKLFSDVINKLPTILASDKDARKNIRDVLDNCREDGVEFDIIEMFLCALSRYPYATPHDLEDLVQKKLKAGRTKEEMMIFCYSKLSTQQKGCLQYLTAFLQESSISRTSIVRRWVAEGLIGREQGTTHEEAGESCFHELQLRCFVRPKAIGDSGTVKSCIMDKSVREFIINISKSENFVSDMPSHLVRQLRIREIVQGPRPEKPQAGRWSCNICSGDASGEPQPGPDSDIVVASDGGSTAAQDLKEPMDKLVDFLKELPKLYRLNVLDLGGCKGVRKRHLKSICKVAVSLKYLCLRKTDMSRLPARHIEALRLLETLDIRETEVPPADTKNIFLPQLKHLLAGSRDRKKCSLNTVRMPLQIGRMREMETLSHVQVSDDGAELAHVSKLMQLRKLGLVLHGNDHKANSQSLLHVIIELAKCLRSLSIWVSISSSGVSLDMSYGSTFPASSMVLENLEIKGQVSLPSWILNLEQLANLTLIDTQLKDGGIRELGKLQGLRSLRLGINSYSEKYLTFHQGQDEFKALKFLVVEGNNIAQIVFTGAGVAPSLEKIVLDMAVMDDIPFYGLKDLQMLKVIKLRLTGDCSYEMLMKLEGTIAALERRPSFTYSFAFPDKVFEGAKTVVFDAEQ